MKKDPIQIRVRILFGVCVALGLAIVGRSLQVQVVGDARLEKLAKRQFRSTILVNPRRGMILDRSGSPLAINKETFSLAASPSRIGNKKALARVLARDLRISRRKILRKLNNGKNFVWIQRHVPDKRAQKLRDRLRNGKLADQNGLWLVKENKRVYPHGELASHVLGSVNVDSSGIEGVELWRNEELKGEGNRLKAFRDRLGRSAFIDAVQAMKLKDGQDIALTIDVPLQFEVESALKNSVEKHKAQAGTVIAMNAVSGEILALANYPNFNANKRRQKAENRRNRAFTDGFEPGSTMKPLLYASALQHGFDPRERIHGGNGKMRLQRRIIREAEAHEKFGWMTPAEMVQMSSNVVAAKLALKIGSEKYYRTLRDFGFAEKTNTGFPGEISGRIPRPKKIRKIRLANLGFGQGLLATRIQMVRAYASLFNGGWLVQPRLIQKDINSVEEVAPRRILTREMAEQVVDSLKSAVEDGTGNRAQVAGYRIAGKTGTAQRIDPETGRYSRKDYISSFIGAADNVEPKIVIFTSIDRPRGKYYAADTAAPLFREVFRAVAARFKLPDDLNESPVGQDWIVSSQAAPQRKPPVRRLLKWHGKDVAGRVVWKVPEFRSLTSREVMRSLEGHDFEVEMKGFGIVSKQSPLPGELVRDGEKLSFVLEVP